MWRVVGGNVVVGAAVSDPSVVVMMDVILWKCR